MGSFIKIVFPLPPIACPTNPYSQVGLSFLQFYGNPIGYAGRSALQPTSLKNNGKERIDQILIELGVPLSVGEWNASTNPCLQAVIDDDTRDTIKGVEKIRGRAYMANDFSMLQTIANDMKELVKIGEMILKLKRELAICVMNEDYTAASKIKASLLTLERRRDNYDATYQTERYEKMIIME